MSRTNAEKLIELIEKLIELKIQEQTVDDHNGPSLSMEIGGVKYDIETLLIRMQETG